MALARPVPRRAGVRMSSPVIMGAICKRCENGFRFIKHPGGGRRRQFCEPCQHLERLDNSRFHNQIKKKVLAA